MLQVTARAKALQAKAGYQEDAGEAEEAEVDEGAAAALVAEWKKTEKSCIAQDGKGVGQALGMQWESL